LIWPTSFFYFKLPLYSLRRSIAHRLNLSNIAFLSTQLVLATRGSVFPPLTLLKKARYLLMFTWLFEEMTMCMESSFLDWLRQFFLLVVFKVLFNYINVNLGLGSFMFRSIDYICLYCSIDIFDTLWLNSSSISIKINFFFSYASPMMLFSLFVTFSKTLH
jgi:hypothetical protein